ncbi:DNA-binding protein [Bacteroidia bacterium]|nr:DNA-binding protein [Bacteroidia bacterium]
MNDTERKAVIALRLENAQQTLQEAKLLMDNAYWNAAINRMYYACYYAVSALLIKNGIQAQTHTGVRQMLGLHFVKTNLLSSQNNAFYSDLFAKRHSGDYDVYIYFDKDVTVGLYPQSIEFITAIEKLIKNP